MTALRVACEFGRPDVDQFLGEITHAQYVEWVEYFDREPRGWAAINAQTARLSVMLAQPYSRKPLKDSDFEIRFVRVNPSVAIEVNRIRAQVAAKLREQKKRKRARNG